MQITVSGQHMDVGNSLQLHVKEKLIHIVQKYFGDIIHANVHFTKDSVQIICNIELVDPAGKHILVKNQQTANLVNASHDNTSLYYAAFDNAVISLEKLLRKYKSRLKDRHEKVKISKISPLAVKYVLNGGANPEEGQEDDNPVIVAEKPVEIETLSVSEAVMVMDLKNLPALIFYNSKNGRINTVYYRKDGNISWIDTLN